MNHLDLVFYGCWLVEKYSYLLFGFFVDVGWWKRIFSCWVLDYLIWSWFGLFLNEPPGFGVLWILVGVLKMLVGGNFKVNYVLFEYSD